jgi:hypothetical protein
MFEFNVSPQTSYGTPHIESTGQMLTVELLRHLLAGQQRQNELLEELIGQVGAVQRQRASEIDAWKDANPHLAKRCRKAAEVLAKVQTQYLESMTDEVRENAESFLDGEFMLNEFVDRFGPRLAHLNGVLQVLSQLSSVTEPAPAR